MAKNKLKMSNKRFRIIMIPIMSIVAISTITATILLNSFSLQIDSMLGKGKMHVETAEGTENWNTNYYEKLDKDFDSAKEKSKVTSEQIANEGIVLLKNNGVLPLEKNSSITPFGYGYLNAATAGTGAAASSDTSAVSLTDALSTNFKINDAAIKKMNAATPVAPDHAEGTPALNWDKNSLQAMSSGEKGAKIFEYDASIYNGIEASINGSAGLVFINRNGSEGVDKRYFGYDDGTPHYLALTANEKATIKFVKQNCKNCVIVLNTANPMELSCLMGGEFEADAILWIGTPGSRGFLSTSKILCGEVNPSGHLTDIYATDFTKDPTYQNFGEYTYTNSKVTDHLAFIPGANKGTMDRKFVEYEEGIYIGYRYYETAALMNSNFVYGELDGKGAWKKEGAVTYPFGYGLSYTTFDKKIVDFTATSDKVKVDVEVTNTGDMDGKEVVQIYYTAPYDKNSKIEKAATVLAGFEKTNILKKNGGKEIVTIEFDKEEMASYNYHHKNIDGTTGCYQLDEGTYIIELKNNSHDKIDSREIKINSTTYYEGEKVRNTDKDGQSLLNNEGNSLGVPANGDKFVAATNQFETMNAYMNEKMITSLSRNDWNNTFPTSPVDRKGEAPSVALEEFARSDNFDYEHDTILGNVDGSKVYTTEQVISGQNNGLSLIDMRGLNYYDEAWEKLLDQIDWTKDKEQIQNLLFKAAYTTSELTSIGKPTTIDKDGAMGISSDNATAWASANLVSCTWNLDLLYQMGVCLGQEALQVGIHGWYAPAVNIHRSPFAGRVYEYYSEDPLISGKMAAAVSSGVGDQGVFPYVKHFALNDQESWRSVYLATWANEQTVREIYLRPFEICIKEATSTIKYISDDAGTLSSKVIRSCLGVMSSQNCIGGTIGFAHYGSLTGVLRGEWGFTGAVVTDLYLSSLTTERDMMLRAGGDMWMAPIGSYFANDYDSATIRSLMRESIHRICYMVVNSSAMNKLAPGSVFWYEMSPWRVAQIEVTIAIVVLEFAGVAWIILRTIDEKKKPEKYIKKEKI